MDFSTLVEKFRYLIEENKKQTIFVCSILIFMTLCGFFVLLLSTSQQEKKEKWSEEEANEWFTVPDETEIEKLSQSNDKIVKDIIGAAP